MEVFNLIWDFLFGTFIRIINYMESWFANATEAGFNPSAGTMITISIFILIFCGSGMTAMTFAEIKNRNRWLHGILGLMVPIVYPVILYFAIPKAGVEKKSEEEEKPETAEPDVIPDSDLKAYTGGQGDGTGIHPSSGQYDQNYFSKISKDEKGNFQGPFILELDDNQILEIECIVEALTPAVAVQIGQGDEGRTIRLPYNRIKGCKTKRRWLAEAEEADTAAEEEMDTEKRPIEGEE